jgi:hypothetical protein
MFKRLLSIIVLSVVLSAPLLSQTEVGRKSIITSTQWTNQMVWSDLESKWLFVDNHDKAREVYMWDMILYDNHTGIMKCGDVNYTINSWSVEKTDDGTDLMDITAYNHKISRSIRMLFGRPDGKNFLAIYDDVNRIAFYFAE